MSVTALGSDPEIMLVMNVAVAVLGTAVRYWRVDQSAPDRLAAVHATPDRVGAGPAATRM